MIKLIFCLVGLICMVSLVAGNGDSIGEKRSLPITSSSRPESALGAAYSADMREDPNDPFITTRSGKLRSPERVTEKKYWEEDTPLMAPKPLVRKKRCGGGGGDDDGGNANRARRARRARANRVNSRRKTTTVTRQVIQNGQVVSQTTETVKAPGRRGRGNRRGGTAQQVAPTVAMAQQPGQVVVQSQPVTQAGQVLVQNQPVIPQAPVVVQQPAVAQPVVVQQPQPQASILPSLPNLSVSNSVNVGTQPVAQAPVQVVAPAS